MDTDIKHVMQFFAFAHLPPHLQEVSRPFGEAAQQIVDSGDGDLSALRAVVEALPANRERAKALDLLDEAESSDEVIEALDHLLAAKDAAVRARLAKEV